ncbi:MAG: type I-B CRISPR-associated protein Cas5b [Atribacterota bacterium]|jgi:CRISPR-associated protein Cas5h|nr:type I-B CRISPR-associated protein Cas5b [Atribacterota bacterium]
MKYLAFDIYGDYAHFKKFYTTSSPLTFSFPPPPTIGGMIAAICGIDKKNYLDILSFDRCQYAIRILSPIQKVRMGLNHINTKGNAWQLINKKNHEPRTQIRTEFLKSPRYRIYFSHDENEIYQKVCSHISNHWTYYTFSLGLSELIGDYSWVGEFEGKEISFEEHFSIDSVIPIPQINLSEMKIEEGKRYFRERIPVNMDNKRIVKSYEEVLFESNGNNLTFKKGNCIELENGEKIVTFSTLFSSRETS